MDTLARITQSPLFVYIPLGVYLMKILAIARYRKKSIMQIGDFGMPCVGTLGENLFESIGAQQMISREIDSFCEVFTQNVQSLVQTGNYPRHSFSLERVFTVYHISVHIHPSQNIYS